MGDSHKVSLLKGGREREREGGREGGRGEKCVGKSGDMGVRMMGSTRRT